MFFVELATECYLQKNRAENVGSLTKTNDPFSPTSK
jgi:hypothetical protein